jgi:hypothetical protein
VRVATVPNPIPVTTTAGKAIPNPLLVPVTLDPTATGQGCGRNCGDGCAGACKGKQVVPRAPDASDLVNAPDTYSADLGTGGCIAFNVPNRSIDEFDFYTVVRTTEPEIRGVTLGAPLTRPAPPPGTPSLVGANPGAVEVGSSPIGGRAEDLADGIEVKPLALTSGTTPNSLIGPLGPFSPVILSPFLWPGRPAGRGDLTALNPVDWDSSPTFFEAATIAHGHLLHMKQVWYADGYSLGDLLYSLPLAPGQKRVIAVLDWERRDQAGRTEGTFFTEGLQASLTRDRDVNEVVSGTLTESLRGGSSSTTAGVGVGTGAAGNGSYQGFNFGALLGISGGYGESTASAWQDSARTLGAQSMQGLRDTTLQSASAIRGAALHRRPQREPRRGGTCVDRGRRQPQPVPRPNRAVLRSAATPACGTGAR